MASIITYLLSMAIRACVSLIESRSSGNTHPIFHLTSASYICTSNPTSLSKSPKVQNGAHKSKLLNLNIKSV